MKKWLNILGTIAFTTVSTGAFLKTVFLDKIQL